MISDFPAAGRQRGLALVTSLLILLVMTVIGVSAVRTTTMEEKMAGNMRDHNLAFQAAETGLRDGEKSIEALTETYAFDGSYGLLGKNDSEPDRSALLQATTWTDQTSQASPSLQKTASSPRYIIKMVRCNRGTNQALNIQGYGNDKKKAKVVANHLFRITSRGTGGSDLSQVVVRSMYGVLGLDAPADECVVAGYDA